MEIPCKTGVFAPSSLSASPYKKTYSGINSGKYGRIPGLAAAAANEREDQAWIELETVIFP